MRPAINAQARTTPVGALAKRCVCSALALEANPNESLNAMNTNIIASFATWNAAVAYAADNLMTGVDIVEAFGQFHLVEDSEAEAVAAEAVATLAEIQTLIASFPTEAEAVAYGADNLMIGVDIVEAFGQFHLVETADSYAAFKASIPAGHRWPSHG